MDFWWVLLQWKPPILYIQINFPLNDLSSPKFSCTQSWLHTAMTRGILEVQFTSSPRGSNWTVLRRPQVILMGSLGWVLLNLVVFDWLWLGVLFSPPSVSWKTIMKVETGAGIQDQTLEESHWETVEPQMETANTQKHDYPWTMYMEKWTFNRK